MASLVLVLITVLFLKLQLAKDCSQNAIMKTLGISHRDLVELYLVRTGTAGFPGIILGLLFAGTLGEKLISAMFKILNMGLVQIVFIISPFEVFVVCPLLFIGIIILSTYLSTAEDRKNNSMLLMKE